MEKEIWKPIEKLNGLYEVSNLGRVRSVERTVIHKDGKIARYKERILKQCASKKGYMRVYPTVNGKKYNFQVHRLVAEAFVPNPENKQQVNHKDGNKKNNRADNLEWVTNDENELHANINGLRAEQHTPRKVAQYTLDGKLVAVYRSTYQASKATGIKDSRIGDVCHGSRHTCYGFIFKFV